MRTSGPLLIALLTIFGGCTARHGAEHTEYERMVIAPIAPQDVRARRLDTQLDTQTERAVSSATTHDSGVSRFDNRVDAPCITAGEDGEVSVTGCPEEPGTFNRAPGF